MIQQLWHWELVRSSVSAGYVVEDLPLNIGEEGRGPKPEKVPVQPVVAKLLFHQNQPTESVLGGTDTASRLEPNLSNDGFSDSFLFIQLPKSTKEGNLLL